MSYSCNILFRVTKILIYSCLKNQTLKSTQAMGEAMKGVTKAMGQMNRQMNLPSLQKIMQEFEKQNEKMEMVTEVMGDSN